MTYRTYITADAAVYDREVLENIKDSMFWWRMSYRYQSIWRNLHIDGFEGYLWNRQQLPGRQDIHYNFFTYANHLAK